MQQWLGLSPFAKEQNQRSRVKGGVSVRAARKSALS